MREEEIKNLLRTYLDSILCDTEYKEKLGLLLLEFQEIKGEVLI